eukprot:scaffold3416_cov237-Alexandrium_tamarense.AAC.6
MNEEVAKEHLKASLSNCKALRDAGYEAKLDPTEFGTEAHPNHVSCLQSPDNNATAVVAQDNNFRTAKADFLLFTWNNKDRSLMFLKAEKRYGIGWSTSQTLC